MTPEVTESQARDALAELMKTHGDPGQNRLSICRVTDYEIEKHYSVFLVTAEDGQINVLKHNTDSYEPRVYELIVAPLGIGPKLLSAVETPEGSWLLLQHLERGDLRRATQVDYRVATEMLAGLHTRYSGLGSAIPGFLRDEGAGFELLLERVREAEGNGANQLPRRLTECVVEAIKTLGSMPQTVIHGDPLPNNVVLGKDGPRFIDWGSTAVGPYAYDLARLLSVTRDGYQKLLLSEEAQLTLVHHYRETRKALGKDQEDLTRIGREFTCGRICNYAEIVVAFLRHGWPRSPWYSANLESIELECTKL